MPDKEPAERKSEPVMGCLDAATFYARESSPRHELEPVMNDSERAASYAKNFKDFQSGVYCVERLPRSCRDSFIQTITNKSKKVKKTMEILFLDTIDERNSYTLFDKILSFLSNPSGPKIVFLKRIAHWDQRVIDAIYLRVMEKNTTVPAHYGMDIIASKNKLILELPQIMIKSVEERYNNVSTAIPRANSSCITANHIVREYVEGLPSLAKQILLAIKPSDLVNSDRAPFCFGPRNYKKVTGSGRKLMETILAPEFLRYLPDGIARVSGNIDWRLVSYEDIHLCLDILTNLGLIIDERHRPLFSRKIYYNSDYLNPWHGPSSKLDIDLANQFTSSYVTHYVKKKVRQADHRRQKEDKKAIELSARNLSKSQNNKK